MGGLAPLETRARKVTRSPRQMEVDYSVSDESLPVYL
jgi:hypothetical protein